MSGGGRRELGLLAKLSSGRRGWLSLLVVGVKGGKQGAAGKEMGRRERAFAGGEIVSTGVEGAKGGGVVVLVDAVGAVDAVDAVDAVGSVDAAGTVDAVGAVNAVDAVDADEAVDVADAAEDVDAVNVVDAVQTVVPVPGVEEPDLSLPLCVRNG